ncbi:uncharacterized protein LOC135695659 isoform X1 [Rhopilema esculentum]|uniref:uncharacterized protein LOC135695659 isoform X1 n=1 Tax=Rhopilema esculentum TaxID=499914 RepID=UPI0031DDA4E7
MSPSSKPKPFHQMTLKVGTIHHQLKYKDGDEIEGLACDEQQTGEETPTAKKIAAKKPSMLKAISEDQFEDVPDTFDPDSRIGQGSDGVPDDEMPCATDRIPETYEPSSGKKGLDARTEVSSQVEDDAEPAVCCHCGVNQDDGLMILCGVCETWQHAVCFAILESADAPVKHTCATCAEKFDDHRCTDPRLERLNRNELQATCLWRRAMIATSEMTRITVNLLTRRLGTTSTIASHILKRLEKEGYVKTTSKNKRIGKFVNKEKILRDGVCTYFRTSQDVCQSDPNSQESNDTPSAEGVDAIVTRASKMELEEKKPQHSSQDKEMSEIQDICREKTRKRVISTVNEGDEFEISDSQDVMDAPSELRPAKRSKASAAVHSLLV